ncbi:unnamed protein product [Callosobruchus maculatus]|nr:unnamed protein product [Callosobruchus maculatus]
MQFLQFTIVGDVIQRYYNVEASLVDATGLIFFITYILFFLPISYLIEKYSLRVTLISSISLTATGNLVKFFSDDPNSFYLVLIGQGLCGVGQVYLLSIPSKLASTWFGAEEVSTACAIGVLGSQLGAALGAVFPPFLVKSSESISEIGEGIRHLVLYNLIVSVIILVLIVFWFRARPSLPPSQSQALLMDSIESQEPFFKNCKDLMKNQDFILILISLGIFNGIWNSFGILVNTIYLKYFPDGGTDVGIITLCSIISGGCIGSVIFGLILDKTHKFKKTTFLAMIFAAVTFAVNMYMFITKSRLATFFTTPLFGFFIASTLVISFEYALEVTYPIPESISCSVLNAAIFLFAIICTLTFEALFDAVDYIYTFVFILILMLGCTALIYFISDNLRRRDANVGQSRNSSRASIED